MLVSLFGLTKGNPKVGAKNSGNLPKYYPKPKVWAKRGRFFTKIRPETVYKSTIRFFLGYELQGKAEAEVAVDEVWRVAVAYRHTTDVGVVRPGASTVDARGA